MLRNVHRSVADEAARLFAACATSSNALHDTPRAKATARYLYLSSTASAAHGEEKAHDVYRVTFGKQPSRPIVGNGLRAFKAGNYPPHEVLSMPALSPTMEVGNLVQWRVKEGDQVEAGSILADIETDKATLGFETQDDGFIAKLIVGNGTVDIPVGVPIAVLVDSEDAVPAFSNYSIPISVTKEIDIAAVSTMQEVTATTAATIHRNSRIGPAARAALANAGLSAEDVLPSGPNGILTKYDVIEAVLAGTKTQAASDAAPAQQQPHKPVATTPPPAAPALQKSQGSSVATPVNGRIARGQCYTDEPVSTMRRVIAQRLLQSKQSLPAIYVTACVRLKAMSELRAALKSAGIQASVNDFVIKAAARALRAVPGACAGWDEAAEEIMPFPDVDISVAVATEGGLITPIVKAADQKTLSEIGKTMKDLAGRARENKLKLEEFMGGSFSISNLGMFGVKEFSAIINPPQACILAVGGPQEECIKMDDHWVMDSFMNVRLSADNRAVDEATAAAFLESFTFHIENPGLLMA